jgi:pilus assembly protein CpaE
LRNKESFRARSESGWLPLFAVSGEAEGMSTKPMPSNGVPAITWKPLLICPHADLSHKLSAIWRAMEEPQPIVESPRYIDRPALSELIEGHGVTLCFVEMGSDRELALGVVRASRDLGIPVIALHTGNDPDLILSCLRQGAVEFLFLPFTVEQFRSALDRLAKRAQVAMAQNRSGGEVYSLMRGKSGCGTTTVACNLAFQLQALNFRKVLLADLDPITGTIAFLLKLNSIYSFVHALTNSSRMDEPLWRGMVTSCRGVDVLLSPETSVDLVYESADVAAMVNYWRQLYEFVILDIPGPHGEWGLSLAKLCDELLLVTTNELPAVHATQNTLAMLDHHGVSRSKIKLIVNRYNTDIGLSSESIETALELKVFQNLPSDYESVQKALMEGKSIPSGTRVGKSIAELAEKLTGRKGATKKHSLFGGLFSVFQTL